MMLFSQHAGRINIYVQEGLSHDKILRAGARFATATPCRDAVGASFAVRGVLIGWHRMAPSAAALWAETRTRTLHSRVRVWLGVLRDQCLLLCTDARATARRSELMYI